MHLSRKTKLKNGYGVARIVRLHSQNSTLTLTLTLTPNPYPNPNLTPNPNPYLCSP